MKRIYSILFTCLACSFVWSTPAHAQYPTKAIRFILPFPPGGGTDAVGRAMGAGANIGAALAAQSPADGYTLFMMTATHTINVTLYQKLSYSLVKDLAPVTELGSAAMVVVVHPSVPAKSIKELIQLSKARPGLLTHSSSGTGSITQLAGELFKDQSGAKMLHIPYKGGGPSVIGLISGEAAVGFATTPSSINHIKSGRLRALAITTAKRSPFLPKLPTVAESGLPGYAAEAWYGMLVPAGTPKEIIARLNADSVKVLKLPDVKLRFDASGVVPFTSTPEELGAKIDSEIKKWGKVVKTLGLRVN
jgi:tripartite-type tricarboxylate transporter receptor subunit TctC